MAQAQVQVQPQPQPPVPPPNGGVASNGVNALTASTALYVGDLDPNVTDTQLYDLFNGLGQVLSVRVCRDLSTKRSLGYGYVNYTNSNDAARALDELNFTPVNGKPIRVMYSHRDPAIRRSGAGNIFVKNLDQTIDNKALHDTFSTFGNILSCKIVTDSLGQSKGYGFVQFDNEDSAKNAIEKLNGVLLNGKQVFVGPFLHKQERDSATNKIKFNNVYVKNLSHSTTEDDLKKIFGEYGTITSAVVMRDGEGKSKCFGFVNFENPDDAAHAVEGLNGKTFDEKEWYVGKAQKKSEREIELKGRFDQTLKEMAEKYGGLNLYVKNLADSIDDEKLKELFAGFGTITSSKLMRDPYGISRGSGFVAFSTAEEAAQALAEMNGKMVVGKPLYVAVAQKKEERRARLQAQFSQLHPAAISPAFSPHMHVYSPGTPGLPQQLFYGQGPSVIIPPQPGFGYQRQLVPGMRPNFFVPTVQPGHHTHPGVRRSGGGPMQQTQQPLPAMSPQNGLQMFPRGRFYGYPDGRNIPDAPIAAGGTLPIPYDMGFRDVAFSQPVKTGAMATALANATPDQQRTLLGESLYPLVDQLEHENAAKVTGMLLEMDQTEVLHLLESPEALKAKVAEAMDVLRNVQRQRQQGNSPTNRMALLSLNDNHVS